MSKFNLINRIAANFKQGMLFGTPYFSVFGCDSLSYSHSGGCVMNMPLFPSSFQISGVTQQPISSFPLQDNSFAFQSSNFTNTNPFLVNNQFSMMQMSAFNANFQNINFGSFYNLNCNSVSSLKKTGNASYKSNRVSIPKDRQERLKLIMNYMKKVEGGYACVPGDKGGETKHGVTHFTYDDYRRRKHLPKQSVKYMTDAEMMEIIDYFWKEGGAENVKDPILAFYVFSMDWCSGIGQGKKILAKCNNDPKKFEQLRDQFYDDIVRRNPGQKKFQKGWHNRVKRDKNFAYNDFTKTQSGSINYVS